MGAAGCSALLMVDVFTNKFYSLAEKQLLSLGGDDTERLGGGGDDYKVVGSSHGWIALFNYDPLDLFLWNPVTRRRINLPPINNLPTLKDGYVDIKKLILSSSNPEDADCRVVVLCGGGCSRLAFCCPGQTGADWISIGTWWYHYLNDSAVDRLYADMAYSRQQNRLFCTTVYPHFELEVWNLEDPWSPRIDGDDSGQRGGEGVIYQYKPDDDNRTYLVITDDEVLVVMRKFYEGNTTDFIIFKVVQGECGNITVHPLHSFDADLAIFVGLNHSFALSPIEFPELNHNSIYFTDPFDGKYKANDNGIFDYQSRIFYPFYSPQEHNYGSAEEEEEEEEEEDEERMLNLVWFRPSSQV